MENYGKCKNCEYGEPGDHGWKWHCTWYGTLEDPDEVRDCAHYTPRGSGSSGCFLTTACCVFKGLPDDCYELQTLRKFRDEYIKKQPYGNRLVADYYEEAPTIVMAINESDNRSMLLEDTYQTILQIIGMIEAGKNDEAVIEYMMLLHSLSKLIWRTDTPVCNEAYKGMGESSIQQFELCLLSRKR